MGAPSIDYSTFSPEKAAAIPHSRLRTDSFFFVVLLTQLLRLDSLCPPPRITLFRIKIKYGQIILVNAGIGD